MAALAGVLALALFATERENRNEFRRSCHVRSAVRLAGTSYPVLIVDISRSGCKIQFEKIPPLERNCKLLIGGEYRAGRIAWSNRHFAGIKLDKTLSRHAVWAVIRGDGDGAAGVAPDGGSLGAA